MRIIIPSKKGNGGNRSSRPKSKLRREQRKNARKAELEAIDKYIKERTDRSLGIRA